MLSLSQLLVGTAVALTAVSAANLPERREDTSRSMSTDVTTPQGECPHPSLFPPPPFDLKPAS